MKTSTKNGFRIAPIAVPDQGLFSPANGSVDSPLRRHELACVAHLHADDRPPRVHGDACTSASKWIRDVGEEIFLVEAVRRSAGSARRSILSQRDRVRSAEPICFPV